MAVSGGGEQRFRVWIRRRNDPQGPYAIRFEVADGKGILRVARPGVLVDPPARPSGFEERLSASQVRASRFLHVWDGGRYRQGHLLARLDEARLEGMPADRWIELGPSTEGTTALLLLPAEIGPDSGIVDDEPTWPRREMLAGLQRELRGMDPPADEFATEVRPIPAEARARRGLDLDARIPEPRATTDALTDARTVGDLLGEEEARRRATPVKREPPREAPRREVVEPPREAPARPARSLSDLLGAPSMDADDDRTVLVSAESLGARGPARLPDVVPPRAAPRPMLPSVDEEETSIEAFDAPEALEALEAGAAEDEPEALEAMEAPDAAIEALDGADGALEAIEAFADEDSSNFAGGPHTRGAPDARPLVEAVTVMPIGAQELAADVAGRVAGRVVARAAEARVGVGTGDGAARVGPDARGDARPRPVAPVERDDGQEGARHLVGAHARNTTLVRHLRRLLTEERIEKAALHERIAQLEAERARLEMELRRSRP